MKLYSSFGVRNEINFALILVHVVLSSMSHGRRDGQI